MSRGANLLFAPRKMLLFQVVQILHQRGPVVEGFGLLQPEIGFDAAVSVIEGAVFDDGDLPGLFLYVVFSLTSSVCYTVLHKQSFLIFIIILNP